jgi:uncharacterized protein (UPF0261 family)
VPSVVLLGTLDTKGREYQYLSDRIRAAGCDVVLVDAGVRSDPTTTGCDATITADEVAAAAGADRAALAASPDRGAAMAAMTRGAVAVVQKLYAEGRLDAIAGLGGSGGSSLISAAMQTLPFGVPKLLVSTMASGDTRSYVGMTDITMMHSVVDIAGINQVSERVLSNAAAAVAAMAAAAASFRPTAGGKPLLAATMYGTTTPGVTVAREFLEERGYEVVVFHANGTGGRAMETLIRSGLIRGVLDATTGELTDEVVGGTLSAGPDRLTAAGTLGIPQVVSLGGLEQACFGPAHTVPPRFAERPLYEHNSSVTLLRLNREEAVAVGRALAEKLNAAKGPVTVFIPLGGFSAYGAPGGPLHDPAADAALIEALKAALRPGLDVVEMATDINDPAFARAMAACLDRYCRVWMARQQMTKEEPSGLDSDRLGGRDSGPGRTPHAERLKAGGVEYELSGTQTVLGCLGSSSA